MARKGRAYPPEKTPITGPGGYVDWAWLQFFIALTKSNGLLVLGTSAQRAIFSPSVPAGAILIFGEADTGLAYWWNASAPGWESFAGIITVDPAGALDGDGSPGDPLAVRVDGTTIIINGLNELEATNTGGHVLTADPLTPANDTWWVVRDGGTPQSVALKVRIAGVTYPLAEITI